LAQLRVLVVEDEFIIADEIAAMIESGGHRVVGPVGTVDEAIARLAQGDEPDAAVIDANLRGVSSAPVAERLRELQVPFCVCTGYRSNDLKASFGEVDVLEKPINERRLLAILDGFARAAEGTTGL
jgi:CheY-like chemotaxis protein